MACAQSRNACARKPYRSVDDCRRTHPLILTSSAVASSRPAGRSAGLGCDRPDARRVDGLDRPFCRRGLTLTLVLGAGIAHDSNEALPITVFACLAVGAAIGAINGLLVTRLRLPALISTLATATIIDGASWLYTNGAPNGSMPTILQFAANGKFGIVPAADLFVGLVFIAVLILLTRTIFGRRLYATGANPRAAHLAGIRVERVTVIAYICCGVPAAAGGLLLGGYIAVGTLKAGDGYALNSLAVVLIGGTSLSGGEGGVFGTLVGVAILAVLTALLIQLSVPIALRSVLLAIIVIVGLFFKGGEWRANCVSRA
jgi:ribose transport system permease protein